MLPLINDCVFNTKLLPLIANHFKNPKASIDSDHQLSLLLKGEISNPSKKFVFQIENGSIFTVDKKRKFVKEGKKTKRVVCKDLESGKRYLFHPNIEVELVKQITMEETKFNFSEEQTEDQKVEQSKEAVKQDAKGLWLSTNTYIKDLLDFREDT